MSELNPGIRKTVKWLNDNGFRTVDSGDGQTHDYECDREDPYVVIACAPTKLVGEAIRLRALVQKQGVTITPIGEGFACIQASYDPANDYGCIELVGVRDKELF
jgi:hypothetical protein